MLVEGSPCPDSWIVHLSSCYYYEDSEYKEWSMAEDYCQEYGAHLLTIETMEENTFVTSTCESNQDIFVQFMINALTILLCQ